MGVGPRIKTKKMKHLFFLLTILISATSVMGQSLSALAVILSKDSVQTIYLTEVSKTEPRNYYPEIDDFDKVVFTMQYKYIVETKSGLHKDFRHATVHFMRMEGDSTHYKIIGSEHTISSADKKLDVGIKQIYQERNGQIIVEPIPPIDEWIEYHSTPDVTEMSFIGYFDNKELLPVQVLEFLQKYSVEKNEVEK